MIPVCTRLVGIVSFCVNLEGVIGVYSHLLVMILKGFPNTSRDNFALKIELRKEDNWLAIVCEKRNTLIKTVSQNLVRLQLEGFFSHSRVHKQSDLFYKIVELTRSQRFYDR